jgi:hypothetical protein
VPPPLPAAPKAAPPSLETEPPQPDAQKCARALQRLLRARPEQFPPAAAVDLRSQQARWAGPAAADPAAVGGGGGYGPGEGGGGVWAAAAPDGMDVL